MDKEAVIKEMHMALSEALANVRPDAHLTSKSMFGGAGFFVNERIFAAWFGNTIALKLPEDACDELMKMGGTLRSEMGKYVEVPQEFQDNPPLLEPWVARSVDYVLSLPVRKGKKRN